MEHSVVLLGAGRQALETAEYCTQVGYRVALFVEEIPPVPKEGFPLQRNAVEFGAPIVRFSELRQETLNFRRAVTAVGASDLRRRFVELWPHDEYPTICSPFAWVAHDVVLGAGTTIAPRVCLNRLVRIGSHALINVGAILSHDVVVGDYATVSPGCVIGGAVNIDADAFLGIGCVVRNGIRIGQGAIVGAGSVVISDVPDLTTVAGVPARPIDRKTNHPF